MILSDLDIHKALKSNALIITPQPDDSAIDATTVDLRVGEPFYIWNKAQVDQAGWDVTVKLDSFKYQLFRDQFLLEVPKEQDGQYIIRPNQFYLASTLENISLPIQGKLAARVEGKSTLARLGLVIHMTAPTIHCGFDGVVILEIFNYGPFPLRVTPGKTRLCQLVIEKVSSKPQKPGGRSFAGQRTAKG